MIIKELITHFKQKKNKQLYENTDYNLYVVCRWANFGVCSCKWIGKWDKCGNPLIVEYNDHNGQYETYDIVPYYRCSIGALRYWYFDRSLANITIEILEIDAQRKMEKGI